MPTLWMKKQKPRDLSSASKHLKVRESAEEGKRKEMKVETGAIDVAQSSLQDSKRGEESECCVQSLYL